MRKSLCCTLAAFCGLASARHASAVIIDQWNFDALTAPVTTTGTSSGAYSPDVGGGGTLSITHALSSTYSVPTGNGTAHSLSSNTWSQNDYYQFSSNSGPTPGIEIEFDQVSSSTGPLSFQVQYSTDGTNFTNASNYAVSGSVSFAAGAVKSTSPPRYLFDFTGNTALETATNTYFRLVDLSTTGAPTGTDRVDAVTIGTALTPPTPAPEPTSLAILTLGGAALLRRRKLI